MLIDCNGKQFATLEDMRKERERIERRDLRKLAAQRVVDYLQHGTTMASRVLVARAQNVLAEPNE